MGNPWGREVVAVVIGALTAGCTAGGGGEPVETASAEVSAASPGAVACGVRFVATGGSAAPSNDCRTATMPCRTIGQAITAACAGDTVLVEAGVFVENVVIDKSLSVFGVADRTVVMPATSNPNPCSDSSLCGGAASSVILVQAPNVTIDGITVDGDNPALTSGIDVRGADVDARNGIITSIDGKFDGLTVRRVTVQNVYLRGIDASSGGTFRIEYSRVSNLSNDVEADGIFNTGGAGTISDNVVTDSVGGIASNYSSGLTIAGNRVARTSEGIHTDNPGGASGSTSDVVEDNVVTDCTEDGYGLFVFVPVLPATFRGNRVDGCSIGLAAFGEGAAVESRFVGNRIDGRSLENSTGVYVTTSQVGFGSNDVHVLVEGNTVKNTSVGVFLEQQSGFTTTANVECNVLVDDGEAIFSQSSSSMVTDNVILASQPDAGGVPALPRACWLRLLEAETSSPR